LSHSVDQTMSFRLMGSAIVSLACAKDHSFQLWFAGE